MNANRIEEIQKSTGYPESHSVAQALLVVWNETAQEWGKTVDIFQKAVSAIERLVDGDTAGPSCLKDNIKAVVENMSEDLTELKFQSK